VPTGWRLNRPLSVPKESCHQSRCRHVKGQRGGQVHFTADHIFQLGIQLNKCERVQTSFRERRVGVNVLATGELLYDLGNATERDGRCRRSLRRGLTTNAVRQCLVRQLPTCVPHPLRHSGRHTQTSK